MAYAAVVNEFGNLRRQQHVPAFRTDWPLGILRQISHIDRRDGVKGHDQCSSNPLHPRTGYFTRMASPRQIGRISRFNRGAVRQRLAPAAHCTTYGMSRAGPHSVKRVAGRVLPAFSPGATIDRAQDGSGRRSERRAGAVLRRQSWGPHRSKAPVVRWGPDPVRSRPLAWALSFWRPLQEGPGRLLSFRRGHHQVSARSARDPAVAS
jgi:hypothetical protein